MAEDAPVPDSSFQRLTQAMKPITYAFRLYGIPLLIAASGERGKSCGMRLRWLIHCIAILFVVFTVICAYVAIMVYNPFTESDTGDAAQQICAVVTLVGVVITHFVIILKHKSLNELLEDLFLNSVEIHHLRHLVITCVVTSYTLSIIICFNYNDFGKDLRPVDDLVNDSYWEDAHLFHTPLMTALQIAEPIFTGFFILPLYFITIAVFIIVCYTIETNFKQLSLKKFNPLKLLENDGFDGKQIDDFIRRHQTLCHFVDLTDGIFGTLCFIWCSAELMAIVLAVRSMDFNHGLRNIRLQLLTFVFSSIFCFVTRSIFAAKVNAKVLDSLKTLQINPEVFGNMHSLTAVLIQSGINGYILNMSATSPSITGWGFFTVKKGLVLTVGSTILTYVLVLYQN